MNGIKKNSYLLFISIIVISCDSFQDDASPKAEEELDIKSAIAALPNTSLFIDLKKTINTDEVVRFAISTSPTKGNATISEEAVLLYMPFTEFQSGQDFISLDLIDGSGQTIDTDSIFISMTISEDSLPCFNGALSDYYHTQENSSVVIYPISNDGYCVDQISGAVMDILDEPAHGTLNKIELFTYSYLPDDGFIGTDEFMYELTLIDGDGLEYNSLAQINIEVINYQDMLNALCDSLITEPQLFSLITPGLSEYYFDPFLKDPLCGSLSYEIDIVSVEYGVATATDSGQIKYLPGMASEDKILFDIIYLDSDEVISNYIQIEFIQDTLCNHGFFKLEATPDYYELIFDNDSIGTSQNPYLINIADNDIHCFDYTLEILTQPDIGVAEIVDDSENDGILLLSYYSEEEFEGAQTEITRFKYKICSDDGCSEAEITIQVTKI